LELKALQREYQNRVLNAAPENAIDMTKLKSSRSDMTEENHAELRP
jgi:hypothetical protein